jgi:Carboxypeptidase regulatory-like domain
VPESATGQVSADDSFTLEKVQPARYRVRVSGVSGYVKSVRTSDTEVDGDFLDVRSGSRGPVTFTLSSNYCEISGTVSDSNGPPADATVVLVRPEDPTNTRIAHSDPTGAYKFRVEPGKYRLALVDKEAIVWGVQGIDLDDYQPEELELHAGDKLNKDLVQHK